MMFGGKPILEFRSGIAVAAIAMAAVIYGCLGMTGAVAASDYAIGSQWFKRADTDRDQRVTPDEAGRLAIKRFSRLDRDNDGTVTAEEIDQLLAERIARRRERLLRRLDADKDRVITRAEVETRTSQMFTDVDANKDGGITFEEMRAFRAEQRAKRRRKPADKNKN